MSTEQALDLCPIELEAISITSQAEPGRFYELGEGSPHDVAHLAMSAVYEDHRGGTDVCTDNGVCENCVAPHVKRLTDLIEDGQPLQLAMLAFPCKSPNPEKVLGDVPEHG